MTTTTSPAATTTQGEQVLTFEMALDLFLCSLEAKNRSAATLQAYRTDLTQFLAYLKQTNLVATTPAAVTRTDITEYLAQRGREGISGVSRGRKLAAIREYFRFLEGHDYLAKSPATGVETPRREKNTRTFLRTDEYRGLLSQAGAHPRDYAMLQLFLQTGVRVSELCGLLRSDVDLVHQTVTVRGKGMVERTIELERKGVQALKNYLGNRTEDLDQHLFLNYKGEPLSVRMVQKLVAKYRKAAGITKKATPHSFRHTFGTYKAEKGVSPFQLQQWLGHANLNTTQIYVHLGRQNAKKVMEATSL